MALLTWSSKYSVGVQAMDSQHTRLFNILNQLHAAMMKGQAQHVTGSLLLELTSYTRSHFSAEESLMASASYPGLAQHRVRHQDLMKQVEEFVGRHKRGEATVNLHLLDFLRDWLTHHIQQDDRDYGAWLNEHGVR